MAVIEKFEDIEAWQKAREFAKEIHCATDSGKFGKDYALRDQIRRAAVSAMSNIAEGFERSSDKDFVRFLYIAKASAGEVRSLLYLAFDFNYIDKETYGILFNKIIEISRLIGGFIKYLKEGI